MHPEEITARGFPKKRETAVGKKSFRAGPEKDPLVAERRIFPSCDFSGYWRIVVRFAGGMFLKKNTYEKIIQLVNDLSSDLVLLDVHSASEAESYLARVAQMVSQL